MTFRTIVLGTIAATILTTTPAFARVDFDVDIVTAPPPAQVEVVPVARPGYTWIPGYWAWEDDRHVWVKGRWIEDRPGYVWTPEHWEQRGNKWHFERGYWERPEHARANRDHDQDRDRRHD